LRQTLWQSDIFLSSPFPIKTGIARAVIGSPFLADRPATTLRLNKSIVYHIHFQPKGNKKVGRVAFCPIQARDGEIAGLQGPET
jgi:hypothetical protein